jgi:Glycosyl transferase family 2
MSGAELVSVVIPAFNAAATLDDTLCSVRAQTHEALEIIVVDDGSSDGTAAIAHRHAAADPRVCVVVQRNAGVAAARNDGWRRARADLIAFVDADDLWAPSKIERQLQSLHSHGAQTGLVYCGFARIDGGGRIVGMHDCPTWEGDVLSNIFASNFIGNGSAALLRRQALADAGGFDSRLRAMAAGGCEDWLLYFRVAESHHFAVVPEALVGYRQLPNNMSSDRPRMFRSHLLVADEMRARHPDRAAAVRQGLRDHARWLVADALAAGAHGQAAALLGLLARTEPRLALALPTERLRTRAGRLRRRLFGIALPAPAPAHPRVGEPFPVGHLQP